MKNTLFIIKIPVFLRPLQLPLFPAEFQKKIHFGTRFQFYAHNFIVNLKFLYLA